MKNPEPLIQIFCKAPVIGQVKTRLISALGARGAFELHQQMLARVIAELSVSPHKAELWISPDKDHGFFQQFRLPRFQQTGDDLGASMCAALNSGLTRHGSVILLGTDLPLIDGSYVELAVNALQTHEVVLGPAEDGGYGLVGVNVKTPDMFTGIDWGTERVLSQTCARLNRDGLDYHLLPLIWDVDRPADLPRYEAWLGGVS
ncbi:MAG: glycosyltransferase [Gammaproteobacteria bacterium]|nr:glycosyltransferase [Gammaproteobacteria bacterium]